MDLLGAAMDGASITRLARSCQSIGYKPLLATAGGLITPAQSEDPVLRSFGVVSVSGEAPWILDDKPGLKAYRAAWAKYISGAPTDGASAMAWASGELLRAAVEHVQTNAGRRFALAGQRDRGQQHDSKYHETMHGADYRRTKPVVNSES